MKHYVIIKTACGKATTIQKNAYIHCHMKNKESKNVLKIHVY